MATIKGALGIVGGLFLIVGGAVVVVLVSLLLGTVILVLGTLLFLWGVVANSKRTGIGGGAPVFGSLRNRAPVVFGVILLVVGLVIMSVAAAVGDIGGAIVGGVLFVVGMMIPAWSARARQRDLSRVGGSSPAILPFPAPAATAMTSAPSPWPAGAQFEPVTPTQSGVPLGRFPPTATAPSPPEVRFCTVCGGECARAAAFCPRCGRRLEAMR